MMSQRGARNHATFLFCTRDRIVNASLVVLAVLLDLLLAVVVLVGVSLLVRPGQPVHEVVRRLVRDVAQQLLHQRSVVLQLMLDGIPTIII